MGQGGLRGDNQAMTHLTSIVQKIFLKRRESLTNKSIHVLLCAMRGLRGDNRAVISRR